MYVEVAVSGARDPKKDTYTYYTDKVLRPGTLVDISFGPKRTQGVVIATSETTSIKRVLPVLSVPFPQPILLPFQLKLLEMMCHYYNCSLSQLISLVVPQFTKSIIAEYRTARFPKGVHHEQQLILAPSLHKLKEVVDALQHKSRSFLMYTGEQTPKEKARTYLSALQGTTSTILATRSGLFLPFYNLKRIYLYDEHDWACKEMHTPSYHAFDVSRMLAKITSANLVIRDNTPRIQSWWQAKNSKAFYIEQGTSVKHASTITVVDLVSEKRQGNVSMLSAQLIEALKQTLKQKKPVLLYLNKKNEGGMVLCRNCSHFAYSLVRVERCPSCQSGKIVITVVNLKHIAAELNRLLILWYKKPGTWQTDKAGSILTFSIDNVPRITLATQKILYKARRSSFGLVGVVLADTILNLPEFRAAEKTYTTLFQLFRLLEASITTATFIIQTRQPDHDLFAFFKTNSYGQFAKQELEDRKSLSYPPFTKLLLLSYHASTQATVTRHANQLLPTLESIRDNGFDLVEIVGPYQAKQDYATALHKTHEIRILLKAPNRNALQPFVEAIPKTWYLDFDPENLIT